MFENDDMDERKTIRYIDIMEKEEDLKEWIGDDFELSKEYDDIDKSGTGFVTFEELAKWAMMKNIKIEMKKEEEKIKARNSTE